MSTTAVTASPMRLTTIVYLNTFRTVLMLPKMNKSANPKTNSSPTTKMANGDARSVDACTRPGLFSSTPRNWASGDRPQMQKK